MPNFRLLLSRRWLLACFGIAALLFGLAMLHPYPRQSLFGPTIRGKPWCVWEVEVRRFVHRREYEKSLWAKTMQWLDGKQEPLDHKGLFDDAEMMPLALHLLDDSDPKVRHEVLHAFRWYPALRNESALPALYRRLQDDDGDNRIWAAAAIWSIKKDKQAIHVLLNELDDEERDGERHIAAHFLRHSDMCDQAPEIFPHLAKHVHDKSQIVRYFVMIMMRKFGKQGVPVLVKALLDPNDVVRRTAADGLASLGADAKEAIPALEKLTKDVTPVHVDDPDLRTVSRHAIDALIAIDSQRFQHLR